MLAYQQQSTLHNVYTYGANGHVLCRREYGPARMHLVLLGGQPLDELEGWVSDKFGGIPTGKVGPSTTFSKAGKPFEV